MKSSIPWPEGEGRLTGMASHSSLAQPREQPDRLILAGRPLESRLLMGSAQFSDHQTMGACLAASKTQVVTVALRRVNLGVDPQNREESLIEALDGYFLLPNTAGCFTARDAVLTAQLGREALDVDWVKLEVIGDEETLYPDAEELLIAARELVVEGFQVLPYCPDDPVLCQRLEDIGCAAVMPLAAPIGSGLGLRNPHNLALIRQACSGPVIVDAGIGTASDAARVMEMGCDAVLINSAIARCRSPVVMAQAMEQAVKAGRLAYQAGRIPKSFHAQASTPEEGLIDPL